LLNLKLNLKFVYTFVIKYHVIMFYLVMFFEKCNKKQALQKIGS